MNLTNAKKKFREIAITKTHNGVLENVGVLLEDAELLIEEIYKDLNVPCNPCSGIGNLCEVSPHKCSSCESKEWYKELLT